MKKQEFGTLDISTLNLDVFGRKTVVLPTEPRVFKGTREAWCIAIIKELQAPLNRLGIGLSENRSIKISIAPTRQKKILGFCLPSNHSSSGLVNHITISPLQVDEMELAHTCLHEFLHAVDDCNSRHKGRWARMAQAVGIEAKGHGRTPECHALLTAVVEKVGHLAQHEGQVAVKSGSKGASLLKIVCTHCPRYAYIPRKELGDKALSEYASYLVCDTCDALLVTPEYAEKYCAKR